MKKYCLRGDINPPLIYRIGGACFLPLIRFWRIRRFKNIFSRKLINILHQVKIFKKQQDFVNLLGKPQIKEGEHFGIYPLEGEPVVPGHVEIYEKDGCRITVCFKDGRIVDISGNIILTEWDRIAGNLVEILLKREEKDFEKRLKHFGKNEEKNLLTKEIDINSIRLFMNTYFCNRIFGKTNEELKDFTGEFYNNVLRRYSDRYKILADLKTVLEKTAIVRPGIYGATKYWPAVIEFSLCFAVIHPEILKDDSGFYLDPDLVAVLDNLPTMGKLGEGKFKGN